MGSGSSYLKDHPSRFNGASWPPRIGFDKYPNRTLVTPNVSESARTESAPSSKNSSVARVALKCKPMKVLVFGLICAVVFLLLERSTPRLQQTAAQAEPAVKSDQTAANPHVGNVDSKTPKLRQIGEDVGVGYWSYQCNWARWQDFVGSGMFAERPDAAFLIVNVTARNNDNSESTFPPVRLIDAKGREYSQSSKSTLR